MKFKLNEGKHGEKKQMGANRKQNTRKVDLNPNVAIHEAFGFKYYNLKTKPGDSFACCLSLLSC